MAQTGYTPISIYYSSTSTNVPSASNLVAGELAINTADGKLFYKDSAGVVQVIGTKGGVGSSSTTQVLYNSSGLVVGSANMTFNGTTLTLANDASISGLTVGKGAGSGSYNSAFGISTLSSNTSDGNNAFGWYSQNATSTGTYNSSFGTSSMYANTSGSYNVAFGGQALRNNTTGSNNTAVGYQSAYSSTASGNTTVGFKSGYSNTSGFISAAVGHSSLYYNTTGSSSVAVGYQSLYNNTTGNYNTALGEQSLQANTTASNNTAVGYQAGYSNTTGQVNTSMGSGALYANSTGNGSTAIGYNALQANTTASNNTAVGSYSLRANTTGTNNIAVGSAEYGADYGALGYNTTGSNNTAIGKQALLNNTTASNNTAVGYQAGYAQTTGGSYGGYSTYLGHTAGLATTGTANTLIGQQAGSTITSGEKNTLIGRYNGNQNGLDIRTASGYIVLSDGDGNPRVVVDNSGYMAIGTTSAAGKLTINQTDAGARTVSASSPASYAATMFRSDSVTAAGTGWYHFYGSSSTSTVNNIFIYGNGNIQNANNSYGAISDIKLKENIVDATPKLDKLMQVKVRNYNLKGEYEQHKQIGVIAQELETVFPSLIEETQDRGENDELLETTTKSVKYSVFVPILIKAVQELKAEVDSLKAQLEAK